MNGFKLKKLDNAKDLLTPTFQSDGAAGLDVYANVSEPVVIKPDEITKIGTGIKVSIPKGYEIQLRPRSGLAFNHHITFFNGIGTIDSDFRGEIFVLLYNKGKNNYVINRGDRIGQMVINKIVVTEFELVDDLDDTLRGDGGFGSTGR